MSSPLGGATSNLSPSLFSSKWLSRFHLLSLHSFVEVPTTHQGHCQDTCQLRCFANLKPAILSLEDHLRPFSSRTQQALPAPPPPALGLLTWAPAALSASDRLSLCRSACRHPKTSRPIMYSVSITPHVSSLLVDSSSTASTQSHLPETAAAAAPAAPRLSAALSLQVSRFLYMNLAAAFPACLVPCVEVSFVSPSGFLKSFGFFLVFRQPLKAF